MTDTERPRSRSTLVALLNAETTCLAASTMPCTGTPTRRPATARCKGEGETAAGAAGQTAGVPRVAALRRGDAEGELVRARLADEHRAGRPQARHRARIVGLRVRVRDP